MVEENNLQKLSAPEEGIKMSFTDDDLKRFKECVHPISGLHIGLFYPPETPMVKFDLVALLARLEAAERVARLAPRSAWNATLEELIGDWLRAAGKEKDE